MFWDDTLKPLPVAVASTLKQGDIMIAKLARRKLPILFTTLFLTVASISATADQRNLKTEDFGLAISPEAKILRHLVTGAQTTMTLEHKGEKIQVRFNENDLFVNFPTSTLRLRRTILNSAGDYKLTTDFGGKRYVVKRTRREISWLMPGHEVYFRTRGGKIVAAVGSTDFLKLRRDTPSKRVVLVSNAGTSDVSLVKGNLELFDGPELQDHAYFVRGLALQQGPVTLTIPLPGGLFYDALPQDRFLRVVNTPKPLPKPVSKAKTRLPGASKDPLQAEPSTWDSPVYRANHGDRKSDPLNARRENRTDSRQRALDADEQRNSEEVLKVKNY